MNNIDITITGQVGSGKSTIAVILKHLLEKNGIPTTLNDEETTAFFTEDRINNTEHYLSCLNTNVHITTVQANRLPKNKS